MGMDGQTVDTSELWRVDSGRRRSSVARLRALANLPVPARRCSHGIDHPCVCVCGPASSVSSLASLGSPVSSLKGPVSIVRRRVSSCPAGTQARTWRASLVSSCALGLEIDNHPGLFLSFLLLLTDCRLAPARLAK